MREKEGKKFFFVRISYESQNKKINDFMKKFPVADENPHGVNEREKVAIGNGSDDCSVLSNKNTFFLSFTTFSSPAMGRHCMILRYRESLRKRKILNLSLTNT